MTRKKTSTSRRSKRERNRNRNSRPEKQIRVVKDRKTRDRSAKARLRKRKERQRTYKRRRMTLLSLLILAILIPSFLIYKKLSTYKYMDYPACRDEVLDDLANEAFVTSTEGRSLTSAEKSNDFNQLIEYMTKNYAVDKNNRTSYEEFLKQSEA